MNKKGITSIEVIVVLVIIAILTPLLVVGIGSKITTDTNVTITVMEKESVRTGKGSKYLIFTTTEVFECTDSWFDGKFNSSDFYSRIKVGQTYTVDTRGKRIPFWSMYRNIVRIKE